MNWKDIVQKTTIAGMGGALALGAFLLVSPNKESQKIVIEKKIIESEPLVDNYSAHYTMDDNGGPEDRIDFKYASQTTVNAVVHITTTYEASSYKDPFYEYFYGPQGPMKATGSGVIMSSDGYIVTNNHVVEKGSKVEVTLNDKRSYVAKVIGLDPATDLALLKIEETNLPAIELGNSDNVEVGEWVLAVGNPFNLTSTVTAGIVSAKARSINLLRADLDKEIFPIESFIQTDAAVNPGNSGGALVNSKGELVGINTAIASRTGSYAGYSFAVPVNIMKKVTKDLMEYGIVQRAFLGVNIKDIDQKLAKDLDLKEISGVYIARVIEGGAAKEAGLQVGDIVTKIGTVSVNNVPELQEQVGRFRPGDKVAVSIKRDGKEKVINMTLKNKDGNTDIAEKPDSETLENLGVTFEETSSQERKALNIDCGVKVKKLTAGKLRVRGIKEGFIITKVDHEEVCSPEQLVKILEKKKGGVLVEGVYPNGQAQYFGLGL